MKRRINLQLMGIATLAISLTVAFISCIFYDVFKNQVLDDLRISTHLLKDWDMEEFLSGEIVGELESMRVTIVSPDGSVMYDNNANVGDMENHQNRNEVQEALETGEGQAIRKSDTMGKRTFYYAVLREDGTILRLAREANSVWSIMESSLPAIISVVFILILLCLFLTGFITNNLLEPIENLANNLDNIEDEDVYTELAPFVKTIKEQHADILKSARMRQDFTANVSHELKTPLTAISGYAELIENGMAEEKDVFRFAREIHKSSKRLLTLINDIIRLSELDTSDAQIPFEPVNLYAITQTCVDMLQVNAENHQVSLTFQGEPCYILSSKEMMEEVLYNLCDNAIRYNYVNGSVHVSIKVVEDKAVLSVKDTGIGIPEKHQERIFERFYRVDKSRSKSTGGTGLGLAIVKHILVQMDAKMELTSEVGKGTEIKVTFPLVKV